MQKSRVRANMAFGLISAMMLALPVIAAHAAGAFDGVYAGSQTETLTNNSGQCQNMNSDEIRITIVDGKFTKRWKPPIDVTVSNDGVMTGSRQGQQAFRGGSNLLSFEGRITGNAFEADLGTKNCAVHLSLKKV